MSLIKIAPALLLAALATVAGAETVQLPVAAGAASTFNGSIDPTGDADRFAVFLAAGETVKVKSKEAGPAFGLYSTLALADPDGANAAPSVSGQGSQSASFTFTAVKTGTHVVTLTGDPGGFAGSTGNYRISFAVKRGKPAPAKFEAAVGGPIAFSFATPAGSTVTLAAATKKGGLDLVRIDRPDGTPEPGFAAALVAKNRLKASLKKFPLTGGGGTYVLRGQYDAGSVVTVKVTLATGEKKRTATLTDAEPALDPAYTPFPREGVTGTMLKVAGVNFDFEDRTGEPDLVPSFFVGPVAVPPETVQRLNGLIFQFPIPAGLATDATYDVMVLNRDGQGGLTTDAFYVVPQPTVTGLSVRDAGPAGGRVVTVYGQNLRSGSTVQFDQTRSQGIGSGTMLDVVAPAHAPGVVTLTLRDDFGQTAPVPGTFTYLDIGSNRITSIDPSIIQGVGGQKTTVNGADFGPDTVLTLDGVVMAATRISSSVLEFTAPEHAEATVKLRVTDDYGQTSALDVRTAGFTNVTDTAIPAPIATSGGEEAWRATRVLAGDVNGDQKQDLVLLRPEKAFGADANRSRLRLLLGGAGGVFPDATASKTPSVSGDEDWRAKDGVLADLDGDGDLDLAIITDELIASGARSSLRILTNNGSGTFTDATSSAAPAAYRGDFNQGVAIEAANVDGASRTDLVILHTNYFFWQIVTPGGEPQFPDPPPPDIVENFYYPGTRVLLNDGNGVFTRKLDALPPITNTSPTQYQGHALTVGDVNGSGGPDIVITRFGPIQDPADSTNHLRAASLLSNGGNAVFTDVSSSKLPAAGDPEYLQGDSIELVNVDGDSDLDLVVASVSRLVTTGTGEVVTGPAVRMFANDGSGGFTPATGGYLPDADAADSHQADRAVVADLTGDGRPEILLVSARAPNAGERAGRLLVKAGNVWQRGSKGLPAPTAGDDLRGADAAAVDVDGDGDLDLVIVRDEGSNEFRSTLVFVNPR